MNLYSFFQKYRSRIILAAIIIFSGFLLLYKLNNQDITLWDESIHINIVKNLTTHCCIPILHKQDFGLDFRGWDNNYIWMHKPIFPFYLNALIYSLFGKTLLGYRMLGYLAALATATGLYLIGKKFFSTTVGVVAAILFVANPFTNSLVHEFQFSGFVDLTFTAFLLGSLYYLFKIADSPKRKYFLLFALFGSLAFYCKSGLVFGAYLTLAVLSIRLGTKKNFLSFLYSILLTLIVISPEYIVLSHMFPVEFSYEEAQYLGHFGEALEYWGRPWDYYLTYYFSGISGVLLAGYSWLIILISFIKSKANIYIFILLVWILAYIVPVSFAETKISNFIFPILPALCLLIAAVSRLLWNELKYRQVFIYTGAVALLYFCLRFDLFGIKYLTEMQTNILVRFSPLIAYAICAIVIWLVSFLLSKFISIKNLSKFSLVLASILVLLSFIKTDMKADASIPSTSNTQNLIRLSAPTLKSKLPAKSILLTSTDMMQDDDLYFMYWTGFDSLEVRQYQPLDILIKLVPANQPLYLVSDKLQTRLPSGITSQPEFRVPFGYVYKIH